MQEVARSCAAFHRWALLRLLAAVKPLSDADYRRDCGLYFHSLHGTLNHLLVGERTWYARFTGSECAHRALEEEAEAERSRLAFELAAQAERWREFVDTLDDATLGGDLRYRTMNGLPSVTPFGPTLLHVFTHGVHHRGQCTVALTMQGHAAPELDYIYFLRAVKG